MVRGKTYIVPLILSKQNTGFEISGHRGRSIETIRRKVVASFTSAVHRVRFDCAVQTSNSYLFNFALPNRAQLGDLALPRLRPREAEAKFQAETSSPVKNTLPPDLAAALERLGHALDDNA